MTALELFKTAIHFDPEKFTATHEGMTFNIEWEEDPKKIEAKAQSYVDWDYHELTGEWLIHIGNIIRPYKELLFDFYHEVGHILLRANKITTVLPKRYMENKEELRSSITRELLDEMACDKYAIEQLDYCGTVNKYLPQLKVKDVCVLNPDKSYSEIKRHCRTVNNQVAIRRRYLEYLISENIPITAPTKTKNTEKGNAEWLALSGSSKSHMHAYEIHKLVKELAEGFGIDTRPQDDRFKEIPIMNTMHHMQIIYSTCDTFNECVERIIRAISDPHCYSSRFSIRQYDYFTVKEEPANWSDVCEKYFYYDYGDQKSNRTAGYKPYTKTKVIPVDSYEERICIPEFNPNNTYKRVPVNQAKEAELIRCRYKRLVENYLKPAYEKYRTAIQKQEKDMLMFEINEVLSNHWLDEKMPTPMELDEIHLKFKDPNGDIDRMKANITTFGLMSYNDKVKIAKIENKQLEGESEAAYNERIKNIITEQDADRRKNMPLMYGKVMG